MSLAECVAATAAELGLPEKDVRQIAEQLQKHRDRLKRTLPFDEKLQAALRKRATEEGEKARIAAALRKRHVELNIIKREEWKADIATLKADGLSDQEAVMAKLVGSYKGTRLSRKSVGARRSALEAMWLGGMASEIQRDMPHVMPMLRRPFGDQKPFLDDVVREMWKPGSTGNKDAQKVGAVFAKYAEASRLELNRAGANIGKLDGWAPQGHDSIRVARAKQDDWVGFVAPLLDIERSFPDVNEADLPKVLASVYENIVTGRDLTVSAKQQGQRVGPANLAKSLEKSRVLHFKSADAQLAYNEKFGRGHVFNGIVDHLGFAARKASVMQALGPNPQVFLDAALEDMRDAIRRGNGSAAAKEKALRKLAADLNNPTSSRLGKAFAEVTGVTHSMAPGHVTAARIGSGIRTLESMAKLGGAVISSVTDLATYAHAMRSQGKGLFRAQADAWKALMAGRGSREQKQIATLLGAGFDSMLGDIHSRFSSDDSLPGMMSKGQNAFFKLSGLTWWTERLEAAYARMSAAWLGENAGSAWNDLPDALRNTLGQHGIDEGRWEIVRRATYDGEDGAKYILPERIAELPDVDDATKRELQLALHEYIADETTFGVVRADDRTRMMTTGGTQRGTVFGEAIRYLMQFKTFPWAFTRKVVGRTYNRGDYTGLGYLIAASTVLGYAAMTAKDALKNRTPKDPESLATWTAALLQGGGLGIYGDFLFSSYDRFGGSLTSKMAGPTIGAVNDFAALWSQFRQGEAKAADAVNFALGNAPFLNLWWLRAGLDMAVLNNLQEMLSPGTFRRRERKMKKEYGQEYIVEPVR